MFAIILYETSQTTFSRHKTVNNISYPGATALGEALKMNTTLEKLVLWSKINIQIKLKEISHCVFFTSSIGNKIEDTGVKAFEEALKTNTTLTNLNLRRLVESTKHTNKTLISQNCWLIVKCHQSSNFLELRGQRAHDTSTLS